LRLASVLKPEYVFRPKQLFSRMRAPRGRDVRLPWGPVISCDPAEAIGRAIHKLGVYDLPVTEALWRLTDPGDLALDVGANIGYMTAVLSARAQCVIAFEPHPAVFKELQANASRGSSHVRLHQSALTDRAGVVTLSEGEHFKNNRGVAKIVEGAGLTVPARRLDSLVTRADVMKIDVEGHEMSALKGAGELIGTIRDIVFEEHGDLPSPVTLYLQSRGYYLFALTHTLFGPLLSKGHPANHSWRPRNYLATLEPERASQRFKPRGWQCLKAVG
jgi:FkbM family methyltransferase